MHAKIPKNLQCHRAPRVSPTKNGPSTTKHGDFNQQRRLNFTNTSGLLQPKVSDSNKGLKPLCFEHLWPVYLPKTSQNLSRCFLQGFPLPHWWHNSLDFGCDGMSIYTSIYSYTYSAWLLMSWLWLMCVCVEHLNRCKTSTHYCDCRGPRLHSSVRGQRSYWCLERICSLINCTYLHVSFFPIMACGQAINRTIEQLVWASVHFRIQDCTTDGLFRIWSLFYLSHLHLGYSDDYFEEDSLVSRTNLILHAWDSVPHRSYDGSFFV